MKIKLLFKKKFLGQLFELENVGDVLEGTYESSCSVNCDLCIDAY